MTAEIAILNKNAVALAADSAVTLQQPNGPKIYNTANKLFMLSKFHPVGMMVYGNAEFMGVPWETIIKSYRSQLRDKSFSNLDNYLVNFRAFIAAQDRLFPTGLQAIHFQIHVRYVLAKLRKRIDEEVKKRLDAGEKLATSEIRNIIRTRIKEIEDLYTSRAFCEGFSQQDTRRLAVIYRKEIRNVVKEVFQNLPISSFASKIEYIASLCIAKEVEWGGLSGVVVAGFGKQDVFPRLRAIECECIINGKLRFRHDPREATLPLTTQRQLSRLRNQKW